MAARWHETRRESREDAGPAAAGACLFVAFAALYMSLHVLMWVGRVIT